MLPEALSNDLCSLRPDEDRACLAVWITIDRQGAIRSWRFCRGLMRSRARLTYTQVQAAIDGQPDELTGPLLEPRDPAALRGLRAPARGPPPARHDRARAAGAQDRLRRGRAARPASSARQRLASHMLIEEFMIAANVAAASELAEAREPCLYRVHDKPDPTRLEALAQFLEHLGVPWSRTAKQPGDFTRLLQALAEHDMREMASSFVLRSQAQAIYSPQNIGHFGLNLKRYAHFTSPIRRYSDLVVHRALIRQLGLGTTACRRGAASRSWRAWASTSRAPSARPWRPSGAPSSGWWRCSWPTASARVFAARVTTVVYFGLFVTLDETGADGLVPVSTLGDDAFQLDERHQALVGQRTGETLRARRPGQGRAGRGRPGPGHAAVPPRRARARHAGRSSPARPGRRAARARSRGRGAPAGAAAPPPLLSAMRRLPPAWRELAPVMLTATLVGMTFSLAIPLLSLVAGARRGRQLARSASTPPPAGSASSWWRRSSRRLVAAARCGGLLPAGLCR